MIDNQLLNLRHELHRHPELSGQETETARRISDFVGAFGPTSIVRGLGGAGVAVVYTFGEGGPTLLLRAELDALPIEEINGFAHRSGRAGVSHKCGHDGHAAILAGLAPWLQAQTFKTGRVVLLFQPAEETGKGASAVLNDPRFALLAPDYVVALHNVPGYALHEVIWTAGQFSPTVQSMAIRLYGKTAHASEPENGTNPALAVAALVDAFDKLVVADVARADFALITPVHLLVGQPDYGIAAGYGEVHVTLRTWQTAGMEDLVTRLTALVDAVCAAHSLRFDIDWFDYFPATINDAYCSEAIKKAADIAGLRRQQRPMPFKFGEDFGWFTQAYPGAMVGLGAGLDTPALHNPDYDFPDELMATGVRLFSGIVAQFLAS